jgi:hypothetical protein
MPAVLYPADAQVNDRRYLKSGSGTTVLTDYRCKAPNLSVRVIAVSAEIDTVST